MFIAIHDVALRHVPINNWAIINLVLIIAHTISYESQHLYLKNQKKRKPILHELLTYHQTLNLMTLGLTPLYARNQALQEILHFSLILE